MNVSKLPDSLPRQYHTKPKGRYVLDGVVTALQRLEFGDLAGHPFRGNQWTDVAEADVPRVQRGSAVIPLKGLARKAQQTGTVDAFKTIHSVRYGYDEPGAVNDALNLDTVTERQINQASKQIYEASQTALERDGFPERFIVYRTPRTAESGGGPEEGVVSVSFKRLQVFGEQQVFAVDRDKILTYGEGLQRGTHAESELQVLVDNLTPMPTVTAAVQPLELGDLPGHPFRGNQWQQVAGIKDEDPSRPGWQHTGIHGTRYAAWEEIKKNGFDPMAPIRNAAVYGKGVYFALNTQYGRRVLMDSATFYPDVKIHAEVTLMNPIVWKNDQEVMTWRNLAWKLGHKSIDDLVEHGEKMQADGRIPAELSGNAKVAYAVMDLAKERGYDGIIVRANQKTTPDVLAWDQVVVFDADQIRIKEAVDRYKGTSLPITAAGDATEQPRNVVLLSVPKFLDGLRHD